jgi:NTE family protein
MKVGLALSGGGFRATVFHLGVLARLADEAALEKVTFLSSVSGGSLCIGLIHAINDFSWPTSREFIDKVLPKARDLITCCDLQSGLLRRVLRSPLSIFQTKADDLSLLLKKHWGITISLRDLPKQPRWMINATCYETGKNWRFERFRMGDYVFGYTDDTSIPLSDALAASAGFPGLIGPLVFSTHRYEWYKYVDRKDEAKESIDAELYPRRKSTPVAPMYSKLHLWDGGVYDNLGLEGLHNFIGGWRKDIDFLIVSDASGRPEPEKYHWWKAPLRIITGVMMDQVRSLRSRAVAERLINHPDKDRGSLVQIGNTCEYTLKNASRADEIQKVCIGCLGKEEAYAAANMKTKISRLSHEDYELLVRHGYEVADYTLYAYNADIFNYLGHRIYKGSN